MISESYRSDRVDGLPYSTLKAAAGPVKQKIGSPLRSPPIFPLTGWRNASGRDGRGLEFKIKDTNT